MSPRDNHLCAQTVSDAPAVPCRVGLTAGDSDVAPTLSPWPEEPGKAPPGPLVVPGYEILEELGRGGMGIVYKARQTGLDRVVALKTILAGFAGSPKMLARFHAEAECVGRLQHANIVQIHDIGEADGRPYLALEYLEGGSLAEKLKGQPQTPRAAATLLLALAHAVHAAHQQGIIHRDLKPANVLLTADGTPKITDFGIAKQLNEEQSPTRTGEVMGTPGYMAPEQAAPASRHVGPEADVYALGAILYELLTGRPPFHAETPLDTILQVLTEEPTPPRQLRREVPRDLETICLKCLRKKPRQRYGSAAELADDLQRFLNREPIRARRVGLGERVLKWARRRPARAGLAIGTALVLLAATVAGWWYWDTYRRVKVEYYNTFVMRHGSMEGVGRLTEDQARHRFVTYKFYRRAGQVERVEIVNGHDQLSATHRNSAFFDQTGEWEDGKHECRYEFRRDDSGRVTDQIAYNHAGEVLWTFHFTKPNTGYFTDRNGYPCARTRSGAVYVEFVWSAEGFVQEARYRDGDGHPRPDKDGTFGYRQEQDEHGLPIRRTFLDERDQPMASRDGYVTVTLTRDALGNIIEQVFRDAADRPTIQKQGMARVTATYDAYGNFTGRSYFDRQGQPTLHSDGYARFTLAYDAQGNRIEEAFFDGTGHLTPNRQGIARMTWGYDDEGHIVSEAYFDATGQPTVSQQGFASVRMGYDERGNRTDFAYCDREGKPTVCKQGYARLTQTFDNHGNVIAESYFDRESRPTLSVKGFAHMTHAYDERGYLVEEAYFDRSWRPTLSDDNVARITWKRDHRGNALEVSCYGTDGELTRHREWHARMVRTYDDNGNLLTEAYRGPDDRPTLGINGYAHLTLTYDSRGYRASEEYRGLDGKLCLCKAGYARITWTYDACGRKTEVKYYDCDSRPKAGTDNYARITFVYDERGNNLEAACFDVDDKPTRHRQGHSRLVRTYDAQGNVTSEAYFGPDGKATRVNHVARCVFRYDNRGNCLEVAYRGLDDQPCKHSDGNAGWIQTCDDRGNVLSSTFVGLDRKPVRITGGFAQIRCAYDDRGNETERTYRDESGKLVRGLVGGYARVTFTYDDQGHRTGAAYFDEADQPVATNVVVAAVLPGSPVALSGLQVGDVVLSYAGQKVDTAPALKERLRIDEEKETPRELCVCRQGEVVVLQVTPDVLGDADLRDRVPLTGPPRPRARSSAAFVSGR